MPLPPTRAPAEAVAGAAALSVIDYRSTFKATAQATASGVLTATFDAVPPGLIWLIQRMTVFTTSSTATTAAVYAGDPTPSNLVDGTNSGNLDTADQSSPVLVESNTSLNVVWAGASLGAVGTCRIQYQLVQRG